MAGEYFTADPRMRVQMLFEFAKENKTFKSQSAHIEKSKKMYAVGRIRTYSPRGKLISGQSP